MESKHDKFIRLAESRTNSALKTIELISNLANDKNYDYTDQEFESIVKTLKSSISQLEMKYKVNKENKNTSKEFKIKKWNW